MKQKQPKPLNNTQIKLLLAQMVSEFNAAVYASDAKKSQIRQKAIKKYYELLARDLSKIFISQVAAKVCKKLWGTHLHEESGHLSLSFVTKMDAPKKIGPYKPDHWSCDKHPIDRAYKKLRLNLYMATAENYDQYVKEFERACKRILK